jgi:hypothetical protein
MNIDHDYILYPIVRFRPKPVNVDEVHAREIALKYGFTEDPDLEFDTAQQVFRWKFGKISPGKTKNRHSTLSIQATSGRYSITSEWHATDEITTIACGFISDIDTFCTYRNKKTDGFKTYAISGMHISVPNDYYLTILQNYIYYSSYLTNGSDTIFCNIEEGWGEAPSPYREYYRRDRVSEKTTRYRYLDNDSAIRQVIAWIDPVRLCKQQLHIFFLQNESGTSLCIEAIETGISLNGYDRIVKHIMIRNAGPENLFRWKPLISQLVFY